MIETYSPLSSRVKTYQVVGDQTPEFAKAENPLLEEFLKQYYISQEHQGGSLDIGENIDKYIKIDNLTKEVVAGIASISSGIDSTTDTITVSPNTKGFPQEYGLLKIDNEIITYTGVTTNTFTGCTRGFSGITTYRTTNDPYNLTYTDTTPAKHDSGASIQNLSALFLQEFYTKLKAQYTPGLEGVTLSPELNVNNFIKEARNLYESKGTDESFKILFKALFGLEPKINDLEKYLIKPSFANYLRRESFAVRVIEGDPLKLIGQTLYQDNEIGNDLVNAASGPISDVVQIRDDYYRISVFIGFDDRDLIEGNFVIPGKTQSIGTIGIGATVITVDSTIGFGQTGTFQVGVTDDSFYQTLDYSEKTINQFIGVTTALKEIPSATELYAPTLVYGFEDNDLSKRVNMRLTGVISNFESLQNLYGLTEQSRIQVKNLGRYVKNPPTDKTYSQVFFNSWVYNTSARYEIEQFFGTTFRLKGRIDKASIKKNDTVEIVIRNTQTVVATGLNVNFVNTALNEVTLSGTITAASGISYDIRRIQEKATSTGVPIVGGQDQILADVTNAYILDAKYSPTNLKEGYVASNSIPSYDITTEKITATLTDPKIGNNDFEGYDVLTNRYTIFSFPSSVPFKTGEEISYVPRGDTTAIGGLTQASYFVEVLSQNNKIKLYQSRSFIPSGIAVGFVPTELPTGIHDFIRAEQARESIFPSGTLKRFILDQNLTDGTKPKTTSESTQTGTTGMLINGVEITNYKSDKYIYFGPVRSFDIVNAGRGYDVSFPPSVGFETSTSGINTAYGRVSVAGTVTGILVDPVEYEIKNVVSVDVHGGNGSGARAEAITELAYRSLTFNAKKFAIGGNIDVGSDRFILNKEHFYKTGDRVIYNANNNNPIALSTSTAVGLDTGLVEGQSYYVGVAATNIFQIYTNKSDAVAGVNTVSFGSTAGDSNVGIHQFNDYETKRRISRIAVIDSGSGYTNRKISVNPTGTIGGISTVRDFIEFPNHGFKDGEVIHYSSDDTAITGLSTTAQYQVLTIDDNSFRLCNSGLATTRLPDQTNYLNKLYTRFDSTGSGYQNFFYPAVTVDINVVTSDDANRTIEAFPIVRGSVVDTILYDEGRDYGSNIINFEKTPIVTTNYGELGQIGLTIVNGRISDAFVQAAGQNYDGPPDLEVIGVGTANGARLRAVMNGGSIDKVKVLAAGVGYALSTTTVTVLAPGNAATFASNIRRLTGNKFNTSQTTNGDYLGAVDGGLAIESVGYGETVRTVFNDDGTGHSPIIGWAYDGNPIYGPFGFSDRDNNQSGSRRMLSSYKLDQSRVKNRPNTSEFVAGYFTEDYYYDSSGDLDEHNGRFCKTPEYTQGIYAYFATVDNLIAPQFPYYIGHTYRGFPIEENIQVGSKIKQSNFNFENSELVRNTNPYNMFGSGVSYDYVVQPYKSINNVAFPERILSGSIDNIKIVQSGIGYTVGTPLNFDNSDTGGSNAYAIVNKINGQEVSKISTIFNKFEDIIFSWGGSDRVIGHRKPFHQLKSSDYVQVSGLSTSIIGLTGSHQISLVDYSTTLLDTGFVGVVTDIRVQSISPTVSVGATIGFSTQIFSAGIGTTVGVGSETAQILNIFPDDNVLRIRRSGAAATTGILGIGVSFFTDEIIIPLAVEYFESQPNRKIYFNPTESVGFGTTVSQTITRSYQYMGVTKDRSLLTKTIHLENHGLQTNDELTFSIPTSGSNISCATSSIYAGTFNLPSTVYAVKKTEDTIGIKTTKTSADLTFISGGSNVYDYLFEKVEPVKVTGTIEKIATTVETTVDHSLEDGDIIDLIVKPGLSTGIGTTTYTKLKVIDDYLITNPLEIAASGIRTDTNRIRANDHRLVTGERILYYGANLPDGIEQKEYYVVRVDDNTISLTNTFAETAGVPVLVNITSQGGSGQTINPINPQLRPFKNNDLVFDMSDPSLTGYQLKFYYDTNYFNEFVGSASSETFEVIGVSTFATVGIGSTIPTFDNVFHPTTILKYSDTSPELIFYNVFGTSGVATTKNTGVVNQGQVKYVDSGYAGKFNIVGVSNTEFKVNLRFPPESLQYTSANCDNLSYTTQSPTANGGISSITILNRGINYEKVPGISSVAGSGSNAILIVESVDINRLSEVTVPDDVFGYPSDNTLKPDAFIPRVLTIADYSTIVDVRVSFGGRAYITAPQLVIFDKGTGEVVDSGLITCDLSDSAVTSATISVPPSGLSENEFGVIPTRNSNGIAVLEAFADAGILTCKISTPILGYKKEPIAIGDSIFLEGITSYDGTGYNSADYKFTPFRVSDYNNATNPRQVTFDYTGFTTNPGIGVTAIYGFGNITKFGNLATFEVTKGFSTFVENEKFKRNTNPFADVRLDFVNVNTANIIVSGAEDLEVGDILIGKLSGSSARITGVEEFDGNFNIQASVKTTVGWRDNVGLINDTNQVLPDNDYYQNLSYAIESPKTYEDLITYVNDIVHPTGLKNFANTEIITDAALPGYKSVGETFTPAEDKGGLVLDFINEPLRVDAIYPADLARDFQAQGNISKFVELRSTRLADFILNKTNRVLKHDDISPQFVSNDSNDLSPYRIVATYPAPRKFQRFFTQTVHQAEDPAKNQYQLNEFISVTVGQDTFLLQKYEDKNYDQLGFTTSYVQFDTSYSSNATDLIIRPNEPFDTDYEVKTFQSNFSDTVGVGTTAFGHIRLESSVSTVGGANTLGVALTTNVIGVSTITTEAAVIQFVVSDLTTSQVDFFEYAAMHNGSDTYLTELAAFNSKQNLSGLSSPDFIGTFSSYIDGGLLKLDFLNGSQNTVEIKSKMIAVDPSVVGPTTDYRFKNTTFDPDGTERTARLEVTSQAKAGIATVCGIASIRDLSVKSTIHVAIGDTQSIHSIYLLTDPYNQQNFITEYPLASIGATMGIGTFGSTYRPDGHINLEFHPSVSGIVSVSAYNEILYKDEDPNGLLEGIGEISYGSVFENVAQTKYLGINNRDSRTFAIRNQGVPIYAQETNIADPNALDRTTGTFKQEHFFSTFEQLIYKPDSNLIGIGGTALVYQTGAGVTGYLPDLVFAIKDNEEEYRIALTKNDAIAGTAVTFLPDSGAGNKHRFSMAKRDSKSMITISGLVQKPITYTSVNYDLQVPVAGFVTAFVLSGIGSILSGDLIRIEDEYSIVRNVGVGTTSLGPAVGIGTWSLVEVERGAVGTAATPHAAGEPARIFRGSFQILDSNIHFTQAPLGGDLGLLNPGNLPYPRATFGGRTFLRQDYLKNQLFDDISNSFDGLETTYSLTSVGGAVTGIGTTGGNGVLFINNIFQAPFSENNTDANFKIIENAGIASVQFTGVSSEGFTTPIIDIGDVNENQLPRGGIVISAGSTPGRGYAPFVGAKVFPQLDSSGTITNIIGIPTSEGTGFQISTAQYDNVTGILSVTTATNHGLTIDDQIKLVGLYFTCPKDDVGTPTNFVYNPATGISTVTLNNHGLSNGDAISFRANSLTLSCTMGTGNKTYPRPTDPLAGNGQYLTVSNVTTNTFRVNVGAAGSNVYWNPSDADYDPNAGIMTVTIGTHDLYVGKGVVIPDNTFTFTCLQDGNTAQKTYPRATDPVSGASINVVAVGTATANISTAIYDPTAGILTATSAGHNLMVGNRIQIAGDSLTFTCSKDNNATYHPYPRLGDPIRDKWVAVASTTLNTFSINVGSSSGIYPHYDASDHSLYSVATGALIKQTGTIDLNVGTGGTGTSAHTFVSAATSSVQSLPQSAHTFVSAVTNAVQTLNYVGVTTNIFPDYDQSTDITNIVSPTIFNTFVGPSTIPHTYNGGGSPYAFKYLDDLTFGSGYNQLLGTVSIGVTNPVGSGATITATVGAGGSLIFSIDHAGTGYTSGTQLSAPDPNGSNLGIQGLYRLGLGNTTTAGVGASITVDIIGVSTNTGAGSTLFEVSKWEFSKPGYGFKIGDKFTLAGLSTDPTAGDDFLPFEITVSNIFNDDISAWQFGQLDYIDNIKPFQNGRDKRFPLYYQNQLVSFEKDLDDPQSRLIELDSVLLIFVNGVLQEPGINYEFEGGTSISFDSAPTDEDDVFIFFYRGTVGQDSFIFDVNETVKEGDVIELFKSAEIERNNVAKDTTNFAQRDERVIQRIATASIVETPFYQGSGVNNNEFKPLRWTKQKQDIEYGGGLISKARDQYEAQITPICNVLASIASTDTFLFTNHTERFRDIDGNLADSFSLFVHASNVGFGTTAQAGVNYEVWGDIDPLNTDVKGYTGLITGITTSAGIGTDLGLVLQLDTNNLVNEFNASYVQDLEAGYPIQVYGSGLQPVAGVITSIDSHDSDIVGVSTFDVDNIYYVSAISWDGSSRTGVATCNIHSGTDVSGLVGVGSTLHPAARLTWGRFSSALRSVAYPLNISVKGLNYNPDLDEWPTAKRMNIGLRNTGALDKTL